MDGFATSDVRSLVLVGHGGTGKTTLSEIMLNKCGMTGRLGRISDRNTVSDYDVEEKDRQISIDLSVMYLDKNGKRIYLLDAPGYADFVGGAVSGLNAADIALVAINCVNGIEVGTKKIWQLAKELGRPRAIIINKVDAEHTHPLEVLAAVRTLYGKRAVPVNLPDDSGPALTRVISVLDPDGDAGYKQELYEAVVESDEALMEKYLETGEVSAEEFKKAFPKAMVAGSVFPVFFTSSEKVVGVEELLNFVTDYFPAPSDIPPRKGMDRNEQPVELAVSPEGHFAAQVFRIQTDPFVGKLAYFRIIRGNVKTGDVANIAGGRDNVKLMHLYLVQGKEQKEVDKATAGDIVVVSRIDGLYNCATLCDPNNTVQLAPFAYPTPMVSRAIEPKARGDEQKISNAIAKSTEEDPTFKAERTASTNELVISGLGDLHLDVIISRMKRRFDLEVNHKMPKIAYLETITGKSDGHYRHKKQTGGAGQFGEVYLKVEPNVRGKGLEFLDEVVGGVIPRQYIPAVEKGVREQMEHGIIAGYPVVDVTVRLYDGKYHPVDSKEIAFKIAGARAFQEAFVAAKPMLLEPIMKVSIYVPDRALGDITGDLTSRRGRILGMDTFGDMQVVNATVPLAEIQRYSTELRSTTQGEGFYESVFSHYDVVPNSIASGIIERAKVDRSKEEEQ
ncbi:MAG: elongation factor G [Candidatus Brocadiia bacterium]